MSLTNSEKNEIKNGILDEKNAEEQERRQEIISKAVEDEKKGIENPPHKEDSTVDRVVAGFFTMGVSELANMVNKDDVKEAENALYKEAQKETRKHL